MIQTTPTTPDKSAPEKEMEPVTRDEFAKLHQFVCCKENAPKELCEIITRLQYVGLCPAQETGQQDAGKAEALILLDELDADLEYLFGRIAAEPNSPNRFNPEIRKKLHFIKAALSAEKNYVGEDRVKADDFWPIDSTNKAKEPITRPRIDWWWLCKKIEFQRRELKQLNEWLAVYRARESAPSSPREGVEEAIALRGPHEGTEEERRAFETAFRGLHGNSCLAERMEDGDYKTVYASRSWGMWKRACRWSAVRASQTSAPDAGKFKLGDRVTKTKGSKWTGRVVGFYSTKLTPVGYAVESETETGSVQIYPEAALGKVSHD